MADRLTFRISHTKELLGRSASGERLSNVLIDKEIRSLWEWILFFQHERLIHLLVTLFFAAMTLLSFFVFIVTDYLPVTALCALFLVLLIPYIFHYYHLENGVQKLYDLYDQLKAYREE